VKFGAFFMSISSNSNLKSRKNPYEDHMMQSEDRLMRSENRLMQSEDRLMKSEDCLMETEDCLMEAEDCLMEAEDRLMETEARLTAFFFLRMPYFTGRSIKTVEINKIHAL
jgi:hypothetical protein